MIDKNKKISVLGVGNPLMDIVSHVDYGFLDAQQVKPGTMNLIDEERFARVFKTLPAPRLSPGGSCANTLRGFAFLSKGRGFPRPVFIGAVGKDDIGSAYIKDIEAMGVGNKIAVKNISTGASIILVTPDSERTMLTSLGACKTMSAQDVDFSLIDKAGILHITGYQWDTENQKQLVKNMVKTAKEKHVSVSFDLADPFVVSRYRDEFLSWIPDHVDLLFGNYQEYSILAGRQSAYEEVIKSVKDFAPIVIMKTGKDGAFYYANNELARCDGFVVAATDTTGAGDAFAGGLLYGLFNNFPLKKSCRLANKLASLIVCTQGCGYNTLSWSEDVI